MTRPILRPLVVSLVTAASGACARAPQAPVARDGAIPDAAGPDAGGPVATDHRVPGRSVVSILKADPSDPWWVEETLAAWPKAEGDHDLGPRTIVEGRSRRVVFQPAGDERLVDACVHPSGAWSAVGFDADRRIFLVRGDSTGPLVRTTVIDPGLADDPRTYVSTPPDGLRVGVLGESSPTLAADGEDVVVALTTETFAVLLYRFRYEDAFVDMQRTVISPSLVVSPFLPIGASYDNFDAVVAPYLVHLAVDGSGRAFVAFFADRSRVSRHNAVMGTTLALLREGILEFPSDVFVGGFDRDGTTVFQTLVGTLNRDDEPYGIAASGTRVAVVGRTRREPGRDNTELHALVVEIDRDGGAVTARTWDGTESAIAQAATFSDDGRLVVGGTHDWAQNPNGISLYRAGTPFVLEVGTTFVDRSSLLPTTARHAELRDVVVSHGRWTFAGLEAGPLTHTGDVDPSLIRADGYVSSVVP